MTRNHAPTRRLSTILRWSLYILTALALCAVPVSLWLEPGVVIEHNPPPNTRANRTFTMAFMTDGVLMLERYPKYAQMGFSAPMPGWEAHWSFNAQPWPQLDTAWYHPPALKRGNGSGGPRYRIEIPTAPVASILTLVSVGLWWWARINRPPGCCKSCGYSLTDLPSATCPECGVEHG